LNLFKKSEEREVENKNETEKQQKLANKTVDIPRKGNFYEHDNRDDEIDDENKNKEADQNDLTIKK
jgi:hypothetical protein